MQSFITTFRPDNFWSFIGQDHLKSILKTAVQSAQVHQKPLGHCLFIGESGYGKTTLASIVANMMNTKVKHITAYAINKPSEMVSLLNTLHKNDILFIDEIHRLKPAIEEVLYIAMEDWMIDMLMPDGTHIRLPIYPFTLIWATTKSESLSIPLKNRFVYDCHFLTYNQQEKYLIIKRYLLQYWFSPNDNVVEKIAEHVSDTPRDITNLIAMLHDFCSVHHDSQLDISILHAFIVEYRRSPWWLSPIHQRYIAVLQDAKWKPLWIKSIAMKMGYSPHAIEQDIEPVLFKLNIIDKSPKGRVLL